MPLRSLTLLRHTPDISKLAHCVYRLVAPRPLRNGVRNSWLAHSPGSYSKRSLEVAEPSSLLPDSDEYSGSLATDSCLYLRPRLCSAVQKHARSDDAAC